MNRLSPCCQERVDKLREKRARFSKDVLQKNQLDIERHCGNNLAEHKGTKGHETMYSVEKKRKKEPKGTVVP